MGRAPWAAVAAAAVTSLGCQQLLPRAVEPWCRAAFDFAHLNPRAEAADCRPVVDDPRADLDHALTNLQEVCAVPRAASVRPAGLRAWLVALAEDQTWRFELVIGGAPLMGHLVVRVFVRGAEALVGGRKQQVRAVRRRVA